MLIPTYLPHNEASFFARNALKSWTSTCRALLTFQALDYTTQPQCRHWLIVTPPVKPPGARKTKATKPPRYIMLQTFNQRWVTGPPDNLRVANSPGLTRFSSICHLMHRKPQNFVHTRYVSYDCYSLTINSTQLPGLLPGGKAVGALGWPFTPIRYRRLDWVDLHIQFPSMPSWRAYVQLHLLLPKHKQRFFPTKSYAWW
jgi:hypothetical protein